jgi:hypothetical protein
MTHSGGPGVDTWSGGGEPLTTAAFIASWASLAAAARAALAMIPTSAADRTRQEGLVRELALAGARPPGVDADGAVATRARHLVEMTLVGLREPASARPYDSERALALRRRVLTVVADVVDELAGLDLPPRSQERRAVIGAMRAAELAREVLGDEAMTVPR